ncbi:cupin domain-containing protein [Patescibacteria group bacterium]|nr:cupin domain-containing protein [Patescibacteria group bacterium]
MIKEIQHIDKPWGYEEILETNDKYTVKRLMMKNSHQCSYQYHEHKLETIVALSGKLVIIYEDKEVILNPGEVATIEPFEKHRMAAREGDALYLECSTSELDDVVRVEDDYGRS